MSICARPGCFQIGINRCSTCLREPYCSGDCQKKDWKVHKAACQILKKLSNEVQPYHEVVEEIIEASEKGAENIRIIEHVLSYAEFQFGDRIPGKSYRERGNGDKISNWKVEIEIIISTIFLLTGIHSNESLSVINQDNMLLPYLEKVLELLKPWSASIDLDNTDIDSLNVDQVNRILDLSSCSEIWISNIFRNKRDYDRAENCCQRALSCAQRYRYDGLRKTGLLFNAYRGYCDLCRMQEDYTNAITWAEEAYNCVAIAYNPVHPEVQTAAGILIECLIHEGTLEKAEIYAQLTLDSLRDPANGVDQNSEEVANGYYSLAKVINAASGDYVKAEKLAREAYRIHLQLFGKDHFYIGFASNLLGDILMAQGNLGDEVKDFYKRYLAISVRNEGLDGMNAAIGNNRLGHFHVKSGYKHLMDSQRRNEQLRLAKPYYKEAIRIFTKLRGPTNPDTVECTHNLRVITNELLIGGS